MDIVKNSRLRDLLTRQGPVVAAGAYDCISARIAQQCGYEAVYMTGNGVSASYIGRPDVGLITLTEMAARAHLMVESLDVPLISDADTGYGNVSNVFRTVQEFESAGVSAIHIEDQTTPKKCDAIDGYTIIPAEEMAEKVKTAVEARRDPNFVIIARTDCLPILGFDEALRRAKLYAKAGADVVFPDLISTREQILTMTTQVDAPILFDIFEQYHGRPTFSVSQLDELGVKVITHCLSAVFFVCKQLTRLYQHLRENGSSNGIINELMPINNYERLMGLDKALELERAHFINDRSIR